MPMVGVKSISSVETPAPGVKLKCCRRVAMKMKSSILARLSPGQALRPAGESEKVGRLKGFPQHETEHPTVTFCSHGPVEKGMKASRLTNFPSLSRKWAG